MRLAWLGVVVCVVVCLVVVPGAASSPPDLVTAVKAGHLAAVQGLVRKHVDVNAGEVDQTTALHWAARTGELQIARLLIGDGANVNAVNRYGVTPLSLAAAGGSAELVKLLLAAGADAKRADAALPDGQTLLMLASRTGSLETLKVLVGQRADVNASERRTGTTALMWATIEDHPAAVRLLLEAGADMNARAAITSYPHTPPGVIGDKVEEGASYVGQTVLPKGGWTALIYAARQGARDAARALADSGAELNAIDPDGTSALTFAIINGHFDVASLLVDKGANPNLADRAGMTPLYAAVDMHTMATTFGRPDLTPSVVRGSVEAIRMLLAQGADPNARLKSRILKRVYNPGDPRLDEGATPFMRAAKSGDLVVMRLLAQAGADPGLAQKNGNTALMLAAAVGKGSSSNNPDRDTEQDAVEAVKLCVNLGVDINASNAAGDTAVHAAVGSPDVIRFLAERGAKLDAKNKQGRTPLEAALRGREANVKAVSLLRELTGDSTTQ
jgi:ankyrin repeat protein